MLIRIFAKKKWFSGKNLDILLINYSFLTIRHMFQ